jgi:hypothetical protein
MSLSLYEATVPLLLGTLAKLDALLDKAAASGISGSEIVEARLTPDMLPFSKQIQITSDTAKGAVARLAGVENPAMADTETTIPELKDRIAKTVAFIEGVDKAAFDGADDRDVVVKLPSFDLHWVGRDYLRQYVLPNFYFHTSIAYALLRLKGVQIGKSDFLPVDPSAVRPKS